MKRITNNTLVSGNIRLRLHVLGPVRIRGIIPGIFNMSVQVRSFIEICMSYRYRELLFVTPLFASRTPSLLAVPPPSY